MIESTDSHPRRHFLGRAASVLAAFGIGIPSVARADAILVGGAADSEHDAWMKPLKGKHRQIFHATAAGDAAMLMANNFLDAYAGEFAAKPGEVNAVIGIHSGPGGALALAFSDAAWAKYSMGKAASVTDPATKEPAVKNIFAAGGRLGIAESQKRGIVFLICNTAIKLRARGIAAERGETYEAVYADLKGSLLPGMILVPAMVVAINRAQESGFTYLRV
ncbi:MAG: hypothetical protein H0U13_06885 [Gemmatimonadaceae bacterium]|nr:hypothetical protein [Gemmatimonadaceae bacterium]